MAIVIRCNACGKQYNADDSMAGRRVKCRQCGNVMIVMRQAGEDDAGVDLDALAKLEQSFAGNESAGFGPVRSEPVLKREAGTEGYGLHGEHSGSVGRPNYRFTFPLARQIDQWGPALLVVGCIAAVSAQIFTVDQSDSVPLVLARIAIPLLIYAFVVTPLTLVAVRAAARKQRYQLPRAPRWRVFASFMPAFTLAIIFWSIHGALGGLILGAVFGAILSVLLLWLFIRLRPEEVPAASAYSTGAFLGSSALAVAVVFGLNLLLMNVMVATQYAGALPGSPFGQHLAWAEAVEEEQAAPAQPPEPPKPAAYVELPELPTPQAETPAESVTVPDTPEPAPVVTPDPGPAQPGIEQLATKSALVEAAEALHELGTFRELIRPATPSHYFALARGGSPEVVELWEAGDPDPEKWQRRASTQFSPVPGMSNRYVLSADGELLARITNFPRLAVQVWSFSEDRLIQTIDLVPPGGATPEVLAIVPARTTPRLLIKWSTPTQSAIQLLDPLTGNPLPRSGIDTIYFPDSPGTYDFSPDGRWLAVVGSFRNAPHLMLYDLQETGFRPLPIRQLPQLIPPTGVAFSPRGDLVSALFEREGQGLLVTWARPSHQQVSSYIFPSGPVPNAQALRFAGSSIEWLADSEGWLIYGQAIFDAKTGRRIGELGIGEVAEQHRGPDGAWHLVRRGTDNQRHLATVHLSSKELLAQLTQVREGSSP